jgi:hypothetical protein
MGFHKATLKIKDDAHSWDCTSMQWSTCFWWTLGLLQVAVVAMLVVAGEDDERRMAVHGRGGTTTVVVVGAGGC